jgi:hypothetical protein
MADFNQSPADGSISCAISNLSLQGLVAATTPTWLKTTFSYTGPTESMDIRIGSSVQRLDDLTDVIITAPVVLDRLVYDGTYWRNTAPS